MAGGVFGSVPAVWLAFNLLYVTDGAVRRKFAEWSNDNWALWFATIALVSVLTLWTNGRPWRAWKTLALLAILVPVFTVHIMPFVTVMLMVSGWIPAILGCVCIPWVLQWAAWGLVKRSYPEPSCLGSFRDRWILLPFAVVVPALMAVVSTYVSIRYTGLW